MVNREGRKHLRPTWLREDIHRKGAIPGQELLIKKIRQDVLGVPSVGMTVNLSDQGSIFHRMFERHSRIKDFSDVKLSQIEMFQNPTIRTLLRSLVENQTVACGPIGNWKGDRCVLLIWKARGNGICFKPFLG